MTGLLAPASRMKTNNHTRDPYYLVDATHVSWPGVQRNGRKPSVDKMRD